RGEARDSVGESAPGEGSTRPRKGTGRSGEATTIPREGTTTPGEATTFPREGTTLPALRSCLRRGGFKNSEGGDMLHSVSHTAQSGGFIPPPDLLPPPQVAVSPPLGRDAPSLEKVVSSLAFHVHSVGRAVPSPLCGAP